MGKVEDEEDNFPAPPEPMGYKEADDSQKEIPEDPLLGLSPVQSSNPYEEQVKWKRILAEHAEKEPFFRDRCVAAAGLIPSDINTIMTALELSGSDGTTLDIFAAKLRLTEKELSALVNAYPESIGRSMQLARANRKEFVMEGAKGQIFRSSAIFKEYLSNPALKDMFQLEEEGRAEFTAEEKAEAMLHAEGIRPSTYTRGVFLVGDVKEDMDAVTQKDVKASLKKLDFLTVDDLLDFFDKKSKIPPETVDTPAPLSIRLENGHVRPDKPSDAPLPGEGENEEKSPQAIAGKDGKAGNDDRPPFTLSL